MRQFRLKPKSIYSEFFMKKKCVRAEISIPHFATIKNRITENKTLYSCHIVFIPRQNFQVFNWDDFLEIPPTEINTLNFLSLNEFRVLPKNTVYFPHLLTWSYTACRNISWSQNFGLPESHPKLFVVAYSATVKNEFLD